ncbi:MAG: hypothetical protein K2F79_01820, partial [Muribaculaceae bacterium]|nr:hypothetical protein [Muribaculaceae bacterium]
YRYTTFTPNVGSVGTQAAGDAEITWTGDEPSVTFTVGDKAIYGSDGEAKAGQIHIASITIEGDGDGSTPTDPTDPSEPTEPTEPADYYVVNTSDFTNPDLNTVEGFTFEAKTNGGSTAPALNNGNMRLYANNSLTITGDNLTKIEFILSKDASYRYTTVTPSTGAIAPEQVAGDTKFTWVGTASSVTITVGEKATLGTDGESKSGQIRLSGFNIYGTPEEGGDTPVDPIEPTDDIYSGLNRADDWPLDVDAQLPEGLNYVWSWKVYNNSGYLNASGYFQKAFEASAWAVSPVIDLDKRTDATLSFDHAAKFQTSLKELCGVYVKEAASENWEELVIPT